jgi:hypothetical protein
MTKVDRIVLVVKYRMVNPTITIPLDQETAQAYNSTPAEEKRKMQALLGLWLRELVVFSQTETLLMNKSLDGKQKVK